jgi:hypothetical protein
MVVGRRGPWHCALALTLGALPGAALAAEPTLTAVHADAAAAQGYFAQAAVLRLQLYERTKEPVHFERAGRAFLACDTPESYREAARVLRQYLELEQDPPKRAEAERLLAQADAGPTPPTATVPSYLGPTPGAPYPPGAPWSPYGPLPPPQAQEPETELTSPAAVIVGSVLGAGGFALLLGGLGTAIASAADDGCDDSASPDACKERETSTMTKSIAASVAGGVGLVVGLGCIAWGAGEEEVQNGRRSAPGTVAAIGVGPGAARVLVRF